MATLCFKIWSGDRVKKTAIVLNKDENLYENLILKASQKLNINGSKIVLESDGTDIDECEVLEAFHKETLVLLEPNEFWVSHNAPQCFDLSSPNASTISLQDLDTASLLSSDCSSTDLNNPPSTWMNFEINWSVIPTPVLVACANGNKSKALVNAVINSVVDQMREIKTEISSKGFHILSRKLADKYPKIFMDRDDDDIIVGEGYFTTFKKLLDRNNYLNRQNPSKKRSLLKVSLPQKRRSLNSKTACVNWQPEISELATKEEAECIRQKLKLNQFKTEEEIIEALNATYYEQRVLLNNSIPQPPTMNEIEDKFPHLLVEKYIYWHFEKLMNFKIEMLTNKMLKKYHKILSFGLLNKLIPSLNLQQNDQESDKLKNSLKIIASYFKENLTIFLKEYEVSTPTNKQL